jgi:flagellar biosynthesis protein FliR
LALVNKAAPQINVFFLGMPLKAMIGVIVVLLALGPLTTRFLTSAQEAYGRTLELTESVAPEAP